MTDVQIVDYFGFEFNTLFDEDGTPWVRAREAAEALGYDNPEEAVRNCCKDVSKLYYCESMPDHVTAQGIEIIPESDLYTLIYNSSHPKALAFQHWMAGFPSTFETGVYIVGEEVMTEDELIERAFSILQSKVQAFKAKEKEEPDGYSTH